MVINRPHSACPTHLSVLKYGPSLRHTGWPWHSGSPCCSLRCSWVPDLPEALGLCVSSGLGPLGVNEFVFTRKQIRILNTFKQTVICLVIYNFLYKLNFLVSFLVFLPLSPTPLSKLRVLLCSTIQLGTHYEDYAGLKHVGLP